MSGFVKQLSVLYRQLITSRNVIEFAGMSHGLYTPYARCRHIRTYCNKGKASLNICWYCKSGIDDPLVCKHCNKLQDLSTDHDYFEIMSQPRHHDVSVMKLKQKFRQLQTVVHPDKFTYKSEREQQNSAQWSALINKAYRTLLEPMDRWQYLLSLEGEQIPHENTIIETDFLMEVMERNEKVADAKTTEELSTLNEQVKKEIDAELNKVKYAFDEYDYENVKLGVTKIKYLANIQMNINKKLENVDTATENSN